MKPWERFTQGTQEPSGPWGKFEKKREDLPQLTPNTDRKYSALEKAVYTGRAGAEGFAPTRPFMRGSARGRGNGEQRGTTAC